MSDIIPSARRLPMSRLVAEFLVIVLGVVVGLGVDSARGARADSGRAVEYLTQIRDDLSVSESRLADQAEVSERMAASGTLLLDGLNRSPLPPADSLRGWWVSLFNSGSYRVTAPTIDALVAGSDTGLLTDRELKSAIFEYRDDVRILNVGTQLADESIERALERMGEHMSLDNLDSSRSELRLPIDWEAASNSHSFHSLVQTVVSRARARAGGLRELRETALELRRLTELALPKG